MHLIQTFEVSINAIKYQIELFFRHIHPCFYQKQLSKFVDAFREGKDNKQPRFPTASWSVLGRVLAGMFTRIQHCHWWLFQVNLLLQIFWKRVIACLMRKSSAITHVSNWLPNVSKKNFHHSFIFRYSRIGEKAMATMQGGWQGVRTWLITQFSQVCEWCLWFSSLRI